MPNFFSFKDFNFNGKIVALRADLNLSYDTKTGILSESPRLYEHVSTIKLLIKMGAKKIILLSHQGRKGDPDFISLDGHTKLIEADLKEKARFIPFEDELKIIKECLERIIVLDNTRFYEDEKNKLTFEENSKATLPKKLSEYIDYFVLDAFSIAHRNDASVVGFSTIKPCIAGPIFEREFFMLSKFLDEIKSGSNDVFILGGKKPEEPIELIKKLLGAGVEKVLTTGVLSLLILIAKGKILGGETQKFLEEKGFTEAIPDLKNILKEKESLIEVPVDVAIEREGKRVEVSVDNLPLEERIIDIGSKTVSEYEKIMNSSTSIFVKGTAGMYEKESGVLGTKKIFEIAEKNNSVLAGGNTVDALGKLNIPFDKFSYVSLGGGAATDFLVGKNMPGIKALELSYSKFKNRI